MIIETGGGGGGGGGPVFYAAGSRTHLPLGFARFSMRSHPERERRRTLMLYVRPLFVFSSSCYAYGLPEKLVLGNMAKERLVTCCTVYLRFTNLNGI